MIQLISFLTIFQIIIIHSIIIQIIINQIIIIIQVICFIIAFKIIIFHSIISQVITIIQITLSFNIVMIDKNRYGRLYKNCFGYNLIVIVDC
jgi:hypothetical protein